MSGFKFGRIPLLSSIVLMVHLNSFLAFRHKWVTAGYSILGELNSIPHFYCIVKKRNRFFCKFVNKKQNQSLATDPLICRTFLRILPCLEASGREWRKLRKQPRISSSCPRQFRRSRNRRIGKVRLASEGIRVQRLLRCHPRAVFWEFRLANT